MKETLKKVALAGTGVLFAAGIAFAGGANNGTGYESRNESEFEWENETDVDVNNRADIDNEIEAWLNTGENEANFNRACGECDEEGEASDPSITTGNASATVSVTNHVNEAKVHVVAPEVDLEDINWGNSTTGAYSRNESEVKIKNETDVDVNNCADVDNDVDLHVNTGRNEAKFNTGGEVNITTGNASANVSVSNTVNSANVSVK